MQLLFSVAPPSLAGYCALNRAREDDFEAAGSPGGGNEPEFETNDELSMTLKGYAAANAVPAPDSEDGESPASSQGNRHFRVSQPDICFVTIMLLNSPLRT